MRSRHRKREKEYEKSLARKRIGRVKAKNQTYVGYCHNKSHRGFITPELLAGHQCVEKDCPYFSMCQHPIWTDQNYKSSKIKYGRMGLIRQIIREPDNHPHIKKELAKLKDKKGSTAE